MPDPTGVAIDSQERIWIASATDHTVYVFAADGQRLESWGRVGSAPGELLSPEGIHVTEEGSLYVVDSGLSKQQRANTMPNTIEPDPF